MITSELSGMPTRSVSCREQVRKLWAELLEGIGIGRDTEIE
jgi:hypothetical protein